jgi:alpha-tubulin suppressor-like RCC1 family protein
MNKKNLKDIKVGFAKGEGVFSKHLKTVKLFFIPMSLSFITLFFTNVALSQTVTTESLQSVSAGAGHTCGITTDSNKNVECWGLNSSGQLGINSAVDKTTPARVFKGEQDGFGLYLEDASQVSAGHDHTCAVTGDGELYCWGNNSTSQLGNNGPTGYHTTPVRVLKGEQGGVGTYLEGVSQVSVGFDYTCAVTTQGEIYCWGLNSSGQLGNYSTLDQSTPVRVLKGEQGGVGTYLKDVSQVSTGANHTCAVTTQGELYCWGDNDYGRLGINPSTWSATTPARVLKGEQGGAGTYLEDVSQVSAGEYHTCAVTTQGELYCWGLNFTGQLGINSTLDQTIPVRTLKGEQGGVGTYLEDVSQVSTGKYYTCAVTTGGELYCWGLNSSGQLGNNSTYQRPTPVRVLKGAQTGIGSYLENISQVTTGDIHTCGVITGGELYCWGNNTIGELGDGTTTNYLTPAKIFDGSGSAPCQNACCAHWNYGNIGVACSAENVFGCYGAAGGYSVVCGEDAPTGTPTPSPTPTPSLDACPDDPNKTEPGICGCGVPDVDNNHNGIIDCLDPKVPTEDVVTPKTKPATPEVKLRKRNNIVVFMQRFKRAELLQRFSNVFSCAKKNKKRRITFKYEVVIRRVPANKVRKSSAKKKTQSRILKRNRVIFKKQRQGTYKIRYRVKIYKNGKLAKNTKWSNSKSVKVPRR